MIRHGIAKFGRWFYGLDRPKQAAISVASAAGTAAVLYAFFPLIVVGAVLIVLLAHEGGHVVGAMATGTGHSLPVFIPLGVMAFGITVVQKSSIVRRVIIYANGPLAGLIGSVALAFLGWWLALAALIRTALVLSVWELASITIGSDGQKIRAALSERNMACT